MTTDYKPLTPEQMEEVLSKCDLNAGSGWLLKNDWLCKTLQAIEQATIENYLAQHPEPQDAQVGKDVERYRAMRHAAVTNDARFMDALNAGLQALSPDALIHPIAEQFDAFIDAAIAAAKGKE